MMSADKAKELGYTPYARWVIGADIGVRPSEMGIGPAFSNLKAMKLAGLNVSDFDVFECNEAFAAQNLAVIREMEHQSGLTIDQAKWNPNGGAISIGHPTGLPVPVLPCLPCASWSGLVDGMACFPPAAAVDTALLPSLRTCAVEEGEEKYA